MVVLDFNEIEDGLKTDGVPARATARLEIAYSVDAGLLEEKGIQPGAG
jgi:hypothetical protein